MYLKAKEVMKLLGVGQTNAYKIINKLNAELEEKGVMTIRGKVSEKYLKERFGL